MNSKIKKVLINEKIKAREVRVINSEGNQLGIMPSREALRIAKEQGLDLVEVAPNSQPPVCRVMDYGKFKYQQSKKSQEAKKSQTTIQVKEIKVRPGTEEHDIQYKLRNIKRFLGQGNKVKVRIFFKGREIAHSDIGKHLLERIADEVEDLGVVERRPRLDGRNMVMIIAPKS